MDKIEILEAINSGLLKIAGFVTCLSSHFCPIWVDEKSGPGWMLNPSIFSSFLSYNLNKIEDICHVSTISFLFSSRSLFPNKVKVLTIKSNCTLNLFSNLYSCTNA